MMGIARFLQLGLADAERRLARLTAPRQTQDDLALQTVESSTVMTFVERSVEAVERLSHGSMVVGVFRARRRALASPRQAGGVLLVAALVHLLLNVIWGTTPGWFWVVIPATALACGVVLVIGGRRAERATGSF